MTTPAEEAVYAACQNIRKELEEVLSLEREKCAKIAENFNDWVEGSQGAILQVASLEILGSMIRGASEKRQA